MVDAALTAAAEVELPMQTSEIKVTEGLTAGVGEPKKTEDEFTRIMDARVHATNATIERCALICDGLAKARNRNLGCDPYAREQLRMAARTIRKLKDEA